MSQPTASAGHFILVIEPGKVPVTKGAYPLGYVSSALRDLRDLRPSATLVVCRVLDGPRIWATSEKEWMQQDSPLVAEMIRIRDATPGASALESRGNAPGVAR